MSDPLDIAAVVALILVYGSTLNLLPATIHRLVYVPTNLASLVIMLLLSFQSFGLTRDSLGLGLEEALYGALLGLSLSLGVALSLVLVFVKYRRLPLLIQSRLGGKKMPRSEILYRAAWHIPLGTAVFEEMLFRGVLYALIADRSNEWTAVWLSSAFFVAWHFVLVVRLFRSGRLASYEMPFMKASVLSGRYPGVGAAALLTSAFLLAVGLALALLRLFTGSPVAGIAVHAVANSSLLVGWQVALGRKAPSSEQAGDGLGSRSL